MNQDDIIIRAASPADGAALLAIYAPYVQHTAITFEYAVPSLEEFTGRIAATLTKYPYLVAEHQGRPAGASGTPCRVRLHRALFRPRRLRLVRRNLSVHTPGLSPPRNRPKAV